MVKVHLCTFLPSACQVKYVVSIQVGPVMNKSVQMCKNEFSWWGGGSWLFRQSIWGTPCFCFSLQERERGGERGARWLPIGSSYPLDDVCGALPSAAEHTALKEAFFQPKRKSSTSSDPRSLPKKHSSPPSAADPQLLPARFPLAAVQVLHVARLGQVGGGPPPLSSEDTCFPEGCGCVGVGRVEQRGGGVQLMVGGGGIASWEKRK